MKAKWDFEIAPAAARELRRLPRSTQVSILAKLVSVARDPHGPPQVKNPQVKKLKGSPGRFRLRVGDYRVVYLVNEKARLVRVERVRHRKEAYRDL